ncbi:RecQ family ATP-dependent DNA helicase [Priestia megaterium]|uniref:RecQ family ATP-dependent DNA helicase n=1 Tax=Priestia megaterium TaxID=1404 RepID=UPI00164993C2|nr:RecQ family ATP-dependent DNA helicase [Priestia megaterium]
MKAKALGLLKSMVGNEADFKKDQWEAINSVLQKEKTLVVQKTGWGKSMVYFLATRLLRDDGAGPTVLISPLLSLMRNQIDSAKKIGVNAVAINSDNEEEWEDINEQLAKNQIDIILIAPERLSNKYFQEQTLPIIDEVGGIGLFVVDEAHCISDWGHDFRPDYRRIVRVVNNLPSSVPILATTATANSRVIKDVKDQIGHDIKLIRGNLSRESLRLSILRIPHHPHRLAWLAENLLKIKGTGIVYCNTISECERVADWLSSKGINALPYHSKCQDREELENKLINNKVKALIATDALGMGFDKPDIGFVIHFEAPRSLVAYYQQIGRAGRSISEAEVLLIFGEKDKIIHQEFIKSGLPARWILEKVLEEIDNNNGLSINEISSRLNFTQKQIEQCLTLLEIDQLIYKINRKYHRSSNEVGKTLLNNEKVQQTKNNELDKVSEYANTKGCLMKFISNELDDNMVTDCGRCQNCIGEALYPSEVSEIILREATFFVYDQPVIIKPRLQWPANGVGEERGRIPKGEQCSEGRALSFYGVAGLGDIVKEQRYIKKHYEDNLVGYSATFIKERWELPVKPTWVTCVPSLRNPQLVPDLAQRIAKYLGLPFYPVISKVKDTPEQKYMKNSLQQASNIIDAFKVNYDSIPNGPVLLIDDIVNSGWTFTVCGAHLKRKGSGDIIPFALSATTTRGESAK